MSTGSETTSSLPLEKVDTAPADSKEQPTLAVIEVAPREGPRAKGIRFWLVFLAICISQFLSALEFSAVSTTLPTITHALNGDDFIWVASAYGLAATALLPMSGAIAEIFGRRTSTLLWLSLFALGSALCGSAQSMTWVIAGRTVQGAGGGGILSSTSILVSDLVPLKERALYNSLNGFTWGVAAAIGPLVGGAFAKQGLWRWLFYMNLPLTGLAGAIVVIFLKVKTPRTSWREKFSKMDWIGNVLIIASTSSVIIALSWAGAQFAWNSAQVLAPLIIGLVGIGCFFLYEAKLATNPLVPMILLSNRTSMSGHVQNFLVQVVTYSAIYFVPTYFQACWGSSPVRSGVEMLGLNAIVGPVMLLTGAVIALTKRYRPVLWLGWAFYIAAMGAMSTLRLDSTIAEAVGYTSLISIAAGLIFPTTYFPVLAPLPVSENARALAFFVFGRSLAGVWGVTIGTSVLQTQLTQRLPQAFVEQLSGGVSIAYAAIPLIGDLPEPTRTEVRTAFADSLRVLWQVMIGIAGAGGVASLFMKGLQLSSKVDDKWGMEEGKKEKRTVPGADVDRVESASETA